MSEYGQPFKIRLFAWTQPLTLHTFNEMARPGPYVQPEIGMTEPVLSELELARLLIDEPEIAESEPIEPQSPEYEPPDYEPPEDEPPKYEPPEPQVAEAGMFLQLIAWVRSS